MKLLIATHNRGKKAEYEALFQALGITVLSLDDAGVHEAVEEDGATFAENALLKARAYAALTGLLSLADDSGLQVDALGGAPGIYSARYGEAGASDRDRCDLLLKQMAAVPPSQRTARFRCAIALAWPEGRAEVVEGVCEGQIAMEPQGVYGFGYDPIFYLPEQDCTMAQLPPEAKNRISHRARAAHKALEILQGITSL